MRTKLLPLLFVFLVATALLRAQDSTPGKAPSKGTLAPTIKTTGKSEGNASDTGNAKNGGAGSAPNSGTEGVIKGSSSARTPAETNGGTNGDPSLRTVVKGRPVIGVALGGGGAPALSEIGVLWWMEEHHIPVDRIAGTSMGGMVGAFYATGQTIPQMKQVMTADVFQQVFQISTSYRSRNYRRREDSRELPNAATVGLRHGISLRNSLLTDAGLNEMLDREFIQYGDHTNFDSLPIPYRCLTTDLTDAKTVVFSQGSLPDAVRASISIPGLYRPVEINGHRYVDGAVLQNLPVETVRSMQADVVIAISLPIAKSGAGDLDSIFGVLQRSFSVAIEANEERSRKQADVVIMPDVSKFGAGDYLKEEELANQGYVAAEAHKAELMKYSVDDATWQQYLNERVSRTRGTPGNVETVIVEAPPTAKGPVERRFAGVQGAPLDTKQIELLLSDVRSDGRYEADYSVDYVEGDIHRPVVHVMVTDKKTGPPFLLLGANMVAETGPLTRATVEARLLYQDLGGYGSELRGVIQAGSQTEFSAEYYRRIGDNGFFVAPSLTFTRLPYNIYVNQVRLSERMNQNAGGGFDAGWSDGKHTELRAGWQGGYRRWETTIGSDALGNYSGGWQVGRAQFVYDDQDRALVPQFGVRSVTNVGYLYNAVASSNAPQITTQFSYAHQIGAKNIFDFGVDAGTMLHRNVSQPFLFTLGGPVRLAASAVDEYRGTDYFLITPAYLRQIARLPRILGQSIYAGAAYEAGQMHSPYAPTVTRQDAYFGVVAETPLGVISFGPAIGDGGHRKLVFTLGKLF